MKERLTTRQFDLLGLAVGSALLPHLSRLPVWLSLALAIAVPLRVWLRRRGMPAANRWIRLPLTIALVALTWREYGNVFGRDAGAALATGLLALKLLETERSRDARVALGFAAFVLMSALLFDQGLLQTLLVCMALIVVVAALAALQPAALPVRHPHRKLFVLALQLFAAGIPIAMAGFILIPRLASPLWGTPGDQQPRIGLNDNMQPGSMTDLLIDESPALRLVFNGAIPERPDQQFLRAVVLWNFDGATWTRGSGGEYLKPEPVLPQGPLFDYTVTMEASERRWLPSLDVPITVPEGGRMGSERVLLSNERLMQPRAFALRSALDYRLGETLAGSERQRALNLPADRNPRSRELAQRWHDAHPGDPQAIVDEALGLFYRSFSYTLAPPLLGRDSVDEFLFSTQAGYCEHYSSSFVVLMRAAGIPARVVTGYQGGWWSQAGQYLLVRHSDAHAWAEVWMDQRGWVRVDPTAAVNPARVSLALPGGAGGLWRQEGWLRDLRNRFDGVSRLWTEAVVQFNALRQKQALTRFGISEASQRDLITALTIAVVAMLAIATLWALRRTPRRRVDPLDRTWFELCRRIGRRGPRRHAGEGPRDFAIRVQAHFGDDAQPVLDLINRYIALRYGPNRPDPEPVAAFSAAVRKLRLPVALSEHGP